jgi:hypothetical protein
MNEFSHYIGDHTYVSFDGFNLWIYRKGAEARMVLKKQTADNLVAYIKEMDKWDKTKENFNPVKEV